MNGLLSVSGAMIGIIVAILVVVLLVIIIIAWYISTFNTLVRMKNGVEEGWSTIDVYLKKRYDLIPNLVETVKGYAKHESSTLEAVIQARNMAMAATGVEGKSQAESALSGTLKTLFAVSEAYPNLKADSQFLNLQKQLQSLEAEISQARKYYNGVVKTFNNKVMMFPSSIVARKKGFEKQKFFEIDEAERQNVKVSF